MNRYGSVIKLRPERAKEYFDLHASVWPDVQKTMTDSNIRNYTIFYRDGWLFNYFEYVGTNYSVDMEKIARDPVTQRWWDLCMPCQAPLENRGPDEWWASMDEIYHQD